MGTKFQQRYFFNVLFSVLIITLFLNQVHAQEYKVRMATIGNSITYGALLANPTIECYPAQLSDMLAAVYGDSVEIKNYSVSGRTMMRNASAPIWKESAFTNALKNVPDVCLIALGTNDSKPILYSEIGDEFPIDYQEMIDTFKYYNPDIRFILCLPPPIWPGHSYSTSDPHSDSVLLNYVIPHIETIAQNNRAAIVDFYSPFVDSMQLFPDHLHPNKEGSKQMAKILFDTIVKNNVIHQVDAGRAYVSTFKQAKSIVAVGDSIELIWQTIFADSVFLDGFSVNISGSIKVLAEENKVVALTVKSSKNTSNYLLKLNTYNPVESELYISVPSKDYWDGKQVILYSLYLDQNKKEMTKNTSNVTWSIVEGEASLGDQTDTSIVFIPTATGKIIIEIKEGDLTGQTSIYVNSLSSVNERVNSDSNKVFPNPVNEMLYFQLENLLCKNVQIRICNLLGELIIVQNLSISDGENTRVQLNTGHLNKGIYWYSIDMGNNVMYGQFVKI